MPVLRTCACSLIHNLASASSGHGYLSDNHIFFGDILMPAGAAGWYLPNLVNHVDALGDLPKYAITPAILARRFKVEKAVVDHIDKELSCGRVRIARARHGQRAAIVFQCVIRLIVDRLPGRLLNHARFKSATLNHEALYNAVKNRVVIEARLTIVQKILDGYRRFLIESLNNNIAMICMQSDHN